MSHEVRTPLNGILGMAQLLQSPELGQAERLEHARIILSSGQALLTVLGDILDFSKIEAGRLSLEATALQPALLMHDVQALFTDSAAIKGLDLQSHWQGPEQAYLGDPHRLRQILSNLVGNAIKFTDVGHVHIQGCELTRHADGTAELEFAVEDSGMGIPEDKQQRLFQPFSQVDDSTTREYGGTGLGLSIVSSLAALMQGRVGVDSTPGAGSRFWFTVRLPVAQTQAQVGAPAAFSPAALDEGAALSGRVLVAEDNLVNQMVIRSLLEKLGLQVDLVADGQQALDAVQQGHPAQVVLMDLHMPVLDGYAATAAIRQWEATRGQPRRPIIALTADAFEEDRQRCLAQGMDDFLSKPIELGTLHATLQRWLVAGPSADASG
jgi:CheY-like chemotaxis protein